MKKTNDKKHSGGAKIKRFFKHYFGLLVLALACAAVMTLVLLYAFD